MDIPKNLLFTKDDVWILEHDTTRIGITEYAVDTVGEVQYVGTVDMGTSLRVGDEIGKVRGPNDHFIVKSPVAGTVVALNEEVIEDAGVLNEDPYGEGWLIKVDLEDELDDSFMNVEGYLEYKD
ncbi:MAG: glycine cleavage system protein H [Bifidobacteriaceae bacterium]|jgi:glycine cleavage system H protein|nr:glycine cleavage system protein H [Bifidobacteriaceae bacterium]